MIAAVVAAIFVAVALAAAASPEAVRELAAKEGVVEHASHLTLAVGVVVWAGGAATRRSWPMGLGAAFLFIVLGEELDWGGVYQWQAAGGNVHNAWGGASYLAFALPLGVLLVPHVLEVPRLRKALGCALPSRGDAAALAVVAVAALVSTLVPAWESELEEVGELVLYAILFRIGVRASTLPRD